ncbi:pyruvate formate-lyase-activating protein [Defluviitalea saccharophila]|uniref:Pyruvate formate-lyase-activating enzyme n=1 Tax=Defluviitalea saccharophila TaxID=879970 RepID=A0ABZ2Y2P6_9FIRM|nr:pyruvate formate lyase-activating protein [Candidatus Epulonipiscium sp.]
MSITGRIHSIETCGTVDGPGIRFVVFTQGCPLRCQYCHNPDTWNIAHGEETTVEELIKEIEKYKSYMKFSGGGVTLTGGEPLMQPKFAKELFRQCKERGIHTALDTSGYIPLEHAKEVLEYTDLVLLDIKSYDPNIYKDLTGVSNEPTLQMAKYLSDINKPMWVRYVLVPNLTDGPENIEGLASFLSTLNNIEKIELLPFHKMGEYKWEQLGYPYRLKDTPTPSEEAIISAKEIFKKYGLKI